MQMHAATTPFGRRSLTLAQVATQAVARSRPAEKAAHKWKAFQTICAARPRIGVAERALSVLNALLTFHPETVLTGEGLTVFPSNRQLSLRAHGMSATTLRRQLASLVDSGLIVRRDSPNGKRYARKDASGEIETAFGFDLSPIVARADEFEQWAEEVRAEERALKIVRERITICRRDVAKMIAAGVEEAVPFSSQPGSWPAVQELFRSIVDRIPRTGSRALLEPLADELSMLADEVLMVLEEHTKTLTLAAIESQSGCHTQNSNPDSPIDLESERRDEVGEPTEPRRAETAPSLFPLSMVLEACPDIAEYCRGGITNWRDFMAAASVVRQMLGVSPSAWSDACRALGEVQASVVIAAILQRGSAINSAGGYLRGLTRKAGEKSFSVGPMLMSLIAHRRKNAIERRVA